jgi:hypothetical protein
MKKVSTKKSKKKISGKIEKPNKKPPEQVSLDTLSNVKIARMLQDEWKRVLQFRTEIERCQTNIWRLNSVLDKRELSEKDTHEPRSEDED